MVLFFWLPACFRRGGRKPGGKWQKGNPFMEQASSSMPSPLQVADLFGKEGIN